MKVHTMRVGSLQTNCYAVESELKNCAIIDPGADGARIVRWIGDMQVVPKMVLLTHAHYDHIGGLESLLEAFPDLVIYMYPNEAPILDWSRELMPQMNEPDLIAERYTPLKDQQKIGLDELAFQVLHTPGHTAGGVTYRCGDSLFTGDTLFYREIGRCDLPTGDYATMLHSLKKLADLPGDYKVYPGHDQSTTLQFERQNNIYIKKVL